MIAHNISKPDGTLTIGGGGRGGGSGGRRGGRRDNDNGDDVDDDQCGSYNDYVTETPVAEKCTQCI